MGFDKKWTGESSVVSKMGGVGARASSSDVKSGDMVFEPILEEGFFRFDCSVDDRIAAFPSLSFVNPKDRDTPLLTSKGKPSFTPSFECVLGQQIVTIEGARKDQRAENQPGEDEPAAKEKKKKWKRKTD